MRNNLIKLMSLVLSVITFVALLPLSSGAVMADSSKLDGILTRYSTKIYDGYSNKGNYTRPKPADILKDYRSSSQYNVHPRLILTNDVVNNELKPIKSNSKDPRYDFYNKIKTRADNLVAWISQAPEKQKPTYKKMYEARMPGPSGSGNASDDFRYKMMVLGLMYQLSDNESEKKDYANAAWTILDRVIEFKDINPWHNLDFGVFSQGLAIAYDWMYQAWNKDQKARLEEAIVRLCFRVANDSYTPDSPGKKVTPSAQDHTNGTIKGVEYNHNHNSFVNSGIIMASLALMDVYPEITSSLCSDAFVSMEKNLNEYYPSGLSSESPQYWLFTMDNLSMAFSSLDSSLQLTSKKGSIYGLDTCPALAGGKTELAINAIESDAGTFTFGDSDTGKVTTAGELYFYAHYGLQGYNTSILNRIKKIDDDYARLTQAFCWFKPGADNTSGFNKDWVAGGKSAFATFRSSFESGQSFVGIKAGTTVKDSFVHLDQGSFAFHSQGVQWAVDLGKEKYTVTGYNDRAATRWNIFRLRPDGHNCLLIDPNPGDYGYALEKEAKLTTETSDKQAKAVVDLTDLLSSKASSAKRGFLFTDDRKTLVIRDEVTLKQTSDVYWVMYTKQSVSRNGNTVTLTSSDGKKLTIDFTSDQAGEFIDSMDGKAYNAAPWNLAPTVVVDSKHPDQEKNEGYKRIVYKVPNAKGTLKITVKMTPGNVDKSKILSVTDYGDISTWSVNDQASPTPTKKPTVTPTKKPTATPTKKPTVTPTKKPTVTPTKKPTVTPTKKPTVTPTKKPTANPTATPVTKLKGTVVLSGIPESGQTLTVSVKDGNADEYIYLWQAGIDLISRKSMTSYTLTDKDIGKTIKVIVRDKNDQSGEVRGQLISDVVTVKAASITVTPTPKPKATFAVTDKPTVTPTPESEVTVTPVATVTDKPVVSPTITKKAESATPTDEPTVKVTPVVIGEDQETNVPEVPSKLKATSTPPPTSTPTPDPKASVKDFVNRIYEYVLDREPEQDGADYWTDEIWNFRRTGADVGLQFVFSDEFIERQTSDEEFVTVLYRTFFGREPEKDGSEYWISALKDGSMDRRSVATGFVYSDEWADTCAAYGILSGGKTADSIEPSEMTLAFVERMYTTALKRDSDEEGLNYWSHELSNFRATGEVVGVLFFLSEEMNDLELDNKEFVTRLYKTFMDREPEEKGFSFWTGSLDDGMSREEVVLGFTRSDEFTARCVEARVLPY